MRNATIRALIVSIVLFAGVWISSFSHLPIGNVTALHETAAAPHSHNLPYNHNVTYNVTAVPRDVPMPSIDLTVYKDPKGGWNLGLNTTNIVFVPENASLDHVQGQGHAHLYIDGDKITRIYGKWFHIPPEWLNPGPHEIKVVLSANNHQEYVDFYSRNYGAISDWETVIVPEK